MKRLPNCKRDLKKIKINSVGSDLLAAEQKIDQMNGAELLQLTQSKNLWRVGQYKKAAEIFVIYKPRWSTADPRMSDRDGLRIWFCVNNAEEKMTCLIQRADKNQQSQIQTLDEVKRRLQG